MLFLSITRVIFSEKSVRPTLSLVSLADLGEGCRAQSVLIRQGAFYFVGRMWR